MKSYREMLEDEKRAAAKQPGISRPVSPSSTITLDELLGPDRQTRRDQGQVAEDEATEEQSQLPSSPISTALPPGFLTNNPYGGQTYRPPQLPFANNYGSPVVPGTLGNPPGAIPSAPGSNYQLRGNPNYATSKKPALSTSLPAGSLGLQSGQSPTTSTLPNATSAIPRPPMLPNLGDKAKRLDPVPQ